MDGGTFSEKNENSPGLLETQLRAYRRTAARPNRPMGKIQTRQYTFHLGGNLPGRLMELSAAASHLTPVSAAGCEQSAESAADCSKLPDCHV